ncbi:E3 ubiquitin-protein ligase UBR4 [Fasciolopsis buskii]|uniref:E3 ubiquitin-protein ligase UBR4 n=1 Tax=Fasciolopsis buskii TaxID=27845 RepID=A0A8E0VHN0_9TREM|nr:E3 ubiquitin-protein ligase UBR4 [Fasciolopsis buski]
MQNCSEVHRISTNELIEGINSAMSSTENVMDPDEQFAGPELIGEYGDEDRLTENLYMTLPGPLLNHDVCSYTATQQAFVDQHWYHCHSCRLEYSEGVCSVCARVCHSGHDLSYAKQSTFFCDCGASKDLSRRCRALSCRLQNQNIHDYHPLASRGLISKFVADKLLPLYTPWMVGTFIAFVFLFLSSF